MLVESPQFSISPWTSWLPPHSRTFSITALGMKPRACQIGRRQLKKEAGSRLETGANQASPPVTVKILKTQNPPCDLIDPGFDGGREGIARMVGFRYVNEAR
jgi:hypothetical protein